MRVEDTKPGKTDIRLWLREEEELGKGKKDNVLTTCFNDVF